MGNADVCELTVEPVWVDCDDIKFEKIIIDPLYVGLNELFMTYCA
jgi:hypothetical protein